MATTYTITGLSSDNDAQQTGESTFEAARTGSGDGISVQGVGANYLHPRVEINGRHFIAFGDITPDKGPLYQMHRSFIAFDIPDYGNQDVISATLKLTSFGESEVTTGTNNRIYNSSIKVVRGLTSWGPTVDASDFGKFTFEFFGTDYVLPTPLDDLDGVTIPSSADQDVYIPLNNSVKETYIPTAKGSTVYWAIINYEYDYLNHGHNEYDWPYIAFNSLNKAQHSAKIKSGNHSTTADRPQLILTVGEVKKAGKIILKGKVVPTGKISISDNNI